MIGKRHLRVLEALDTPKKRQELASALDYAPKTVSNVVGDLDRLGLITRERSGSRSIIHPVETRCLDAYHSVVKTHTHIDFPDLLTESTLVVLFYLSDEWQPVGDIIERTGLSRATVYRQLDVLTNRAIVIKKHAQYQLQDDFIDLHTFAEELYHLHHRRQLTEDVGSAVIIWESHDEFLIKADYRLDRPGYHRTGLAAFAEYGLDFFTSSGRYYFFSPSMDALTPADLVCHLLLIENDARHRQYALLLLAAVNVPSDTLTEKAEKYDVKSIVGQMPSYLETHGEETAGHLPRWSEFAELANQYEVEV